MQTSRFQIKFQNNIDCKYERIISNVFQNFNYFLEFNNYSFKETQIIIGENEGAHFALSNIFKTNIDTHSFQHKNWFKNKALVIENERVDYIASCFYMINCLQEYAPETTDYLDRFDFKKSYQFKFNCAEENLVLNYFQEMALSIFGEEIPLKKSEYQLSHDIDFINSAWKSEIKTAFKQVQILHLFKILLNKAFGKDSWQNILQIIDAENKKNINSTFFWLTEKGKTKYKNILNADYNIDNKYIKNSLAIIEKSHKHTNGLHKSISSNSLNFELEKLAYNTMKNRFHYLKFNVKKDFKHLENSKIKEDYSLGFSETIGFRNSYGLPFKPFNPITQEQYQFTEFPLHIMDSSLFYFMNLKSQNAMLEKTEQFIQKNNQSSVISILWHNNFYEAQSYKKLLDIITKYFKN